MQYGILRDLESCAGGNLRNLEPRTARKFTQCENLYDMESYTILNPTRWGNLCNVYLCEFKRRDTDFKICVPFDIKCRLFANFGCCAFCAAANFTPPIAAYLQLPVAAYLRPAAAKYWHFEKHFLCPCR